MKSALQTAIENAGHETQSYSGRSMYGATCVGAVIEGGLGMFVSEVMVEILALNEEDAQQAADAFRCMKTDSMGRSGTIVYFPDYEYADDEAEGTDENEEDGE